MIQSLNCPNCNAPLEFDEDGDQIIRCPYCKSNVVVSDYYDQQKKTPGKVKLPPETAEKMAEITQLVSEGKKIEAIKNYQKTFNTGLKAAKNAVEQMERGIAVDIPSR